LFTCCLLKRLPRAGTPIARVVRLPSLQLHGANKRVFSVARDVTQNCGLRRARFKQKSEARRPRISKTRWALAVSCFAGIYRRSLLLTVKLGRDWIARWPVVDNLLVACRLS